MIKAEELRLGNFINVNGVLCRVDHIHDFSQIGATFVDDIRNDGFYRISLIDLNPVIIPNPIPLTEEWLLKFGFEESKGLYNNYRIKVGHYYNSVQLRDDTWFYSNDESDAWCYVVADFKYVHQLQNLYFVLTGQELKIND